MSQIAEKRLFEIASTQQGYFRSQQAVQAGYRINNHPYHIKRGHWIREWRGIYRLANFPNQPEDQYALWSLWSCNRNGEPQGVYSLDTALNIYDVSDIMPTKLHMTVPSTFRRSETPPPLVLHRGTLSEKDYQVMRGFRVTTPLRTFLDIVVAGHIEDHLMQQAASAFTHRGLLSRKDVLALIEQAPRAASFFIERNKKNQHA